jgi:hypothetical protein
VAFSGVLAWLAAIAQAVWLPEPTRDLPSYLLLWVGAAVVGLLAAGLDLAARARQSSRWAREQTWHAVEQFLPCVVAGGLVTLIIARTAEGSIELLPGLWSILFSLGVFASRRVLPGAILGVALYYLAVGLADLALARGDWALSPWAMGLPFGGGQLLTAFVLRRTLERPHATDE